MTSADLSRRLGDALGAHVVTLAERREINAAMDRADTWVDLPLRIRSLVEDIESRPAGLPI